MQKNNFWNGVVKERMRQKLTNFLKQKGKVAEMAWFEGACETWPNVIKWSPIKVLLGMGLNDKIAERCYHVWMD